MMKLVNIDFEFNTPSEKYLNLVCCSLQLIEDGCHKDIERFWLFNGEEHTRGVLCDHLINLNELGYIFLSYGVGAEARSFISLGLDPMDFKWIDLYAEWRMARYNNNNFEYGRYLYKIKSDSGHLVKCEIRESVPPSFDVRMNKGKDNTPTKFGYGDVVANVLGEKIDSVRKEKVRDIIIKGSDEEILECKMEIMEYCDSDLEYLYPILKALMNNIYNVTKKKFNREEILDMMLTRGDYSAAVAWFETTGIPQDMDAIENLSRNNWDAVNDLVNKLNDEHYVFYEKERKPKKDLKGKWVFKANRFRDFLLDNDLLAEWPLTDPTDKMILKAQESGTRAVGNIKTDTDTLDDYNFIPELEALRQTMKSINNLKWFRQSAYEGEDGFKASVGSDDMLRTFYGQFGTQTGRNAPPAKRYTFAMANWLRCTIRPKKGWAVTGIDYKSQEFLLAGMLSKDQNMVDAYRTGDPYLAFAKLAGAVPPDGTKAQYPKIRDLYKAVALGMLYGMGRDALFRRIRASMRGEEVLKASTDKIYSDHKTVFSTFWRWTEFITDTYKYQEYLMLPDGWLTGPHCDSMTSLRNLPVQGMGGCIMRNASVRAVRAGLSVVSPLHDAIYILHREDDEEPPKKLAECMYDATEELVPGSDIKLDIETHDHDHIWVEDRSKAYYDTVKQYLEYKETDADISERVKEKIYANYS